MIVSRWAICGSVLTGFFVLATPAQAVVTLELRPATATTFAGQRVTAEIFAVANPAEPVGILNVILQFDATKFALTGFNLTGAQPWLSSGFPSGGLNTSFTDGDAFFTCNVGDCTPAMATPAGLKVATIEFNTGFGATPFGMAPFSIPVSLGGSQTRVWDKLSVLGCGGVVVPSAVGPAVSRTLNACLSALNCSDGNGCTTDACNNNSVCTHAPNYQEFTHCCNPASGQLTALADGNDCTNDFCNILNGQVSHSNKPIGAACGSTAQNTCTNPDTCDGTGVCLTNNTGNGAPCNDGDSCSQASSCQNGVCFGTNPLPNGTACSDGLSCTTNNSSCTMAGKPYTCCTGSGTGTCGGGACTAGKCVESGVACSGTTPYCIEDETCGKDSDCGSQGTCVSGQCSFGYTCWGCLPEPKACLIQADCPPNRACTGGFCVNCAANVGCVSRYCSPFSHSCVNVQNNAFCFDSSFCNGDETCDIFGNCQPANPPNPSCPPGTVCNEAVDDCVECNDTSNCPIGMFCNTAENVCVECLINAHCNDGNFCNGIETCNAGQGICLAGSAITCSQPNICTIDVCNPNTGQCLPQPAETVACSAQNPCPSGFLCGPTSFCVALNTCTDSNGCTVTDSCVNGACVGQGLGNSGPVNMNLIPEFATPYAIGATVNVTFRLTRPVSASNNSLDSVEGNVNFDPLKLTVQNPVSVDPCTNHMDDPQNCPAGQYDWGQSGLIAVFDTDGLNNLLTDGDYHWTANKGLQCGIPPVACADAMVTVGQPLHVTTLKFTAARATSSAGTNISFSRCKGPMGTFSRVIRGAGEDITGGFVSSNVRINCTNSSQCDDSNTCTTEVCSGSGSAAFCVYTNVTNGTACGNQTPQGECDQSDICQTGVCSPNYKANAVPCGDDGIECTSDLCNGAGTCAHPNKVNGTPCNDGQFCSVFETCSFGACAGGSFNSCNDNVSCTIDTCDESLNQCMHSPDNNVCDDFQYCNGVETCNSVTGCQNGAPPNCNTDGIACTTNDFCNESLNRCDGIPNNALCAMGQICIAGFGCVSDSGCVPPMADSAGGRYIRVQPQPTNGTQPLAVYIDSLTWTCLGKYVGTPVPFDNDKNGTIDGMAAKLVDDPGQAAFLTPAQWVNNVAGGSLWVTGIDIVPTDRNDVGISPPLRESTYRVAVDCGGGAFSVPPTPVVMHMWGDANNNSAVNVADILICVLAINGAYHQPPPPGPPPGSLVPNVDIGGSSPCDLPVAAPAPFVNVSDVQRFVNAFQRFDYHEIMAATPPPCRMPCP